jgi:hypothetical protein
MKLAPTKRLVTKAWTAWLTLFFGAFLGMPGGHCGEQQPATEDQAKALCLLNFAKYVEWPAQAFAGTNSPIVIGVMGGDKFGDDLKYRIEGRLVDGRKIVVTELAAEEDWSKCQILFIAASETGREAEVLKQLKSLPVLTVGETESFTREGGVINFTNRSGKVRFDIDLYAARTAGLSISSKLLSQADSVLGKP